METVVDRSRPALDLNPSDRKLGNIRKAYFASLLSFLKKRDRGPTRFEIARHLNLV